MSSLSKRSRPGDTSLRLPMYDFRTHSRVPDMSIRQPSSSGSTAGGELLQPSDVVIVEGMLIFDNPILPHEFDLRVFVDCDSDVRVIRRMTRDIAERGRDLGGVIKQYMTFVKPNYESFVEPSKKLADIIIPNTRENEDLAHNSAVVMIVQHIKHQLALRREARRDLR